VKAGSKAISLNEVTFEGPMVHLTNLVPPRKEQILQIYSNDYFGGFRAINCSIPKIQIMEFSQTLSKFKMNFKSHFKMFVFELISTNII
jgi:hypothetical protein